MDSVRSSLRSRSVLWYIGLTVVVSWSAIALVLGLGGTLYVGELSPTLMPFVYLAMLAGPSIGGITMIALVDGKPGLLDVGLRLSRWRVALRWYAVALLTAPLVVAVPLLFLATQSPVFRPPVLAAEHVPVFILSNFVVGLIVGFFEELGWTGFAVPRLRTRWGPVTTGLVVGLVWGAWHFLVFWERDTFSGVLQLVLLLCSLCAWLPAYRILMVWVYDHTGSLLVTILMHASLVASQFVLFPAVTGTALLTWILAWAMTLWMVVGALVVVASCARVTGSCYRKAGVLRG